MRFLSTNHVPIPAAPVATWNPTAAHHYKLEIKGQKIKFKDRPVNEPDAPNGRKSRHLDIKIQSDVWIEIELVGAADWHWALANAVTMGTQANDVYFRLEYFTGLGWTASSNGQNCKLIRFGARKIAGAPDNPFPINFNVELEEDDGVVPITIDPDIRNPGSIPVLDPDPA